jgi:hypothetical protein
MRAFFDKENCNLVNKVTYRRKQLPTKILNNRSSKNYIGYELIKADLKNIVEWAKLTIELKANNIDGSIKNATLKSLFISIITTYWKCFGDTKGRNGTKLNKKMLAKEHRSVHDTMKRLRHNFTAHSGDDPFESGYLLHVSDLAGKSRFEPFTIPIHRKAMSSDLTLTNNIINISNDLISQIAKKQDVLLARALESTA